VVKNTMVHPCHGILFSNKEELLMHTASWINLGFIMQSKTVNVRMLQF
jgi:hypothetical protein